MSGGWASKEFVPLVARHRFLAGTFSQCAMLCDRGWVEPGEAETHDKWLFSHFISQGSEKPSNRTNGGDKGWKHAEGLTIYVHVIYNTLEW